MTRIGVNSFKTRSFFAQLLREDRLEDVEEIDHVFFVSLFNLENLVGFPLAVRRTRAFGPEIGIARSRVRMDTVAVVDRLQLLNRRLDVLDVVVVVVVVQHRLGVRRRRGRWSRWKRRTRWGWPGNASLSVCDADAE